MKKIGLVILVLLVGCAGKDGAQGPAGPSGSNQILSQTRCYNSTSVGVSLIYDIVQFPNNQYFTFVEVESSSTNSVSDYYIAPDPNNLKEELVTYSLSGDPPGGGWFFNDTNNVLSVRYSNPGSSHDGFTYTFTSGNCSVTH